MSECPFEQEILDALASRRWPARAGDELHAHVAACESCRDLAAVGHALMHDAEAAHDTSRVPSSASVWHRAQLRAREDAARTAMRPIGFVQGVAFAFGIAAAIAIGSWGLPLLAPLLPDVAGMASSITASLRAPSVSLPSLDLQALALLSNTTVQLALAAWAVLAPLAVYFTLHDSNS
ncbi:MAG: hypothetical protein WD690_13550 [Vicinamibacterales bacterium]